MKPAGRLFGVAAPGLLLAAAGLVTLNDGFVALSLPFLVLVFVDGFLFRRPGRLTATRQVDDRRLEAGSVTRISVRVENSGPSLKDVTIRDEVPAGLDLIDGDAEVFGALPSGGDLSLSYTVRVPRGRFFHRRIELVYRGGLGLVERSMHLEAAAEIYGIPRPQKLRSFSFRPRSTLLNSGAHPARIGGAGLEFFDIRRYMPGDRMRHVNWRASARGQDELYINDFEQERVADIGVVLDARKRAYSLSQVFACSVDAATTVASHFIGEGNRVSLLVYGGVVDWTPPGFGRRHYERISRALARAQPADNQVFADFGSIPRRLFPGQIQLVVLSPLLKEDVGYLALLRRRGYGVLVVSPNAAEAEAVESELDDADDPDVRWALRFARLERRAVVRALRREGVAVVDWNPAEPLADVLRRETRALALEHRLR